MSPVAVLVAVPARDEADRIGECLEHVLVALRTARAAGVIGPSRVAVGAHQCTDGTAALARRVLARGSEVVGTVVEIDEPAYVGEVRTRLVEAVGIDRPGGWWLFSTDADSLVPPDWITGLLGVAGPADADMVVGLTDLVGPLDEPARRAYARLLTAGMGPDGSHRHVYAANLAIRLEVFCAVGGFPARIHGEEHGLLEAVRAAGYATLSTMSPRVQTSARSPGRAEEGLGALLGRLAEAGDDGQSGRARKPDTNRRGAATRPKSVILGP